MLVLRQMKWSGLSHTYSSNFPSCKFFSTLCRYGSVHLHSLLSRGQFCELDRFCDSQTLPHKAKLLYYTKQDSCLLATDDHHHFYIRFESHLPYVTTITRPVSSSSNSTIQPELLFNPSMLIIHSTPS